MLTDTEMPALYQAANANSMSAQRTFFLLTKLRLGGLLLAAAGGGFPSRYGGALALIGFIGALVVEAALLKVRPERTWWEGRAVAESTKTLAWRYAVGGDPFPAEQSQKDASDEFIKQLRAVREGLENAGFIPAGTTTEQITTAMQELRQSPFKQRVEAYREARLEDQFAWYSSKAKWNSDRARSWMWGLLVLEFVGAVFAVLRVANVLDVSLFGFFAAAVAAGATWLQAKQHENLAKAYSVAAQELGEATSELRLQGEEDWPGFVDQAEQAISREHTRWSAQRGVVLPPAANL